MKEEDLCAAFREVVERVGGVVYPETSGYDLLIIGPDGMQIGVQAKLRANVDVLAQVLDGEAWPGRNRSGTDFKAVLVPKASSSFLSVAECLHVLVFQGASTEFVHFELNTLADPSSWRHCHYCWERVKKSWVPPCTVDIPAGVPSPESITPWKIGAVKVCRLLRSRGYVTTRDFLDCGIRYSQYWRQFIKPIDKIKSRSAKGRAVTLITYGIIPGAVLPDEKYKALNAGLAALETAA